MSYIREYRPVPFLCDNILLYNNEGLCVLLPASASLMFSPQITYIASPFRLLQQSRWCKVCVLRTIYVEKCRSDLWFITWDENPFPVICGLLVPMVVLYVYHKHNHRCLMHREFSSVCIRPLCFRLWWTLHTNISTTSHHLTADMFLTQVTNQYSLRHFST